MESGLTASFEGVEYGISINTSPENGHPGVPNYTSAEQIRAAHPAPNVGKMNINGDSWEIFRAKTRVLDRVELFDANTGAMELAPKGVGKEKGAKLILDALPVKPSMVFAFGDAENDLPLLEVADIAVVMGDSDPALFKMADIITGTAQEDGVAHALRALEEYWRH